MTDKVLPLWRTASKAYDIADGLIQKARVYLQVATFFQQVEAARAASAI